ncbi:unnamed protein product [Trypanosoma congolense IL3000]|uniref:WGS project CAEQ00000000 data, annotated contig 1882 n=1 Tax=Trypanosoma congolense (strain IL3000) TaxID=1068625 RepID=F9W9N3_TRYCI|nr:unnamed protein product [Trypanosoma congolense IL3000]
MVSSTETATQEVPPAEIPSQTPHSPPRGHRAMHLGGGWTGARLCGSFRAADVDLLCSPHPLCTLLLRLSALRAAYHSIFTPSSCTTLTGLGWVTLLSRTSRHPNILTLLVSFPLRHHHYQQLCCGPLACSAAERLWFAVRDSDFIHNCFSFLYFLIIQLAIFTTVLKLLSKLCSRGTIECIKEAALRWTNLIKCYVNLLTIGKILFSISVTPMPLINALYD